MAEVKIRTRLDSMDSSHLAETVASPGFRLIRDRLVKQRVQCIEALISAGTWETARYLQGQIAAIERSLQVPEILMQEAKKKNGTGEKG
jgi:hypothetical protein